MLLLLKRPSFLNSSLHQKTSLYHYLNCKGIVAVFPFNNPIEQVLSAAALNSPEIRYFNKKRILKS
jgi:hypothetical protein